MANDLYRIEMTHRFESPQLGGEAILITNGGMAFVTLHTAQDAVEVVRCKDCKHCIYISYACGDVRCGKLHTDYIKEYSFCSYGERKDNAKE